LAEEAAVVTINGRTEVRGQETIDRLRREVVSAAVDGIAADLGTDAGCRVVAARLPDVDILVNNLGIFEPRPFDQISDEDWRRFFETNVLSDVRLARQYLPGMRARTRRCAQAI
jgi:NAD(P)-dependent dehydrogenase (short-subunit alcohol dehydrogenase family)